MYILALGIYMVYTWCIPCIIFLLVPDGGPGRGIRGSQRPGPGARLISKFSCSCKLCFCLFSDLLSTVLSAIICHSIYLLIIPILQDSR